MKQWLDNIVKMALCPPGCGTNPAGTGEEWWGRHGCGKATVSQQCLQSPTCSSWALLIQASFSFKSLHFNAEVDVKTLSSHYYFYKLTVGDCLLTVMWIIYMPECEHKVI